MSSVKYLQKDYKRRSLSPLLTKTDLTKTPWTSNFFHQEFHYFSSKTPASNVTSNQNDQQFDVTIEVRANKNKSNSKSKRIQKDTWSCRGWGQKTHHRYCPENGKWYYNTLRCQLFEFYHCLIQWIISHNSSQVTARTSQILYQQMFPDSLKCALVDFW